MIQHATLVPDDGTSEVESNLGTMVINDDDGGNNYDNNDADDETMKSEFQLYYMAKLTRNIHSWEILMWTERKRTLIKLKSIKFINITRKNKQWISLERLYEQIDWWLFWLPKNEIMTCGLESTNQKWNLDYRPEKQIILKVIIPNWLNCFTICGS